MYQIAIDENVDLIELGPTEDTRFVSPILSRNQPFSLISPVKPFILPMSPVSPLPSSTTANSTTTQQPKEEENVEQATTMNESHMSHLSDVSLGTTPQKLPHVLKLQKSVSTFDVRAGSSTGVGVCIGAAAGSISAATPKKVVVLNGTGKRKQTFSPQEHPDLTLADMLHDLSFSTNKSEDIPVAEDIAEVSKGIIFFALPFLRINLLQRSFCGA
jgi:hypothetical protein